jgi:hypothetical protein
MLDDAPQLPRELQVGEPLVDRHWGLIAGVHLGETASERSFEVARIGAPVEMQRLRLNEQVEEFHRVPHP